MAKFVPQPPDHASRGPLIRPFVTIVEGTRLEVSFCGLQHGETVPTAAQFMLFPALFLYGDIQNPHESRGPLLDRGTVLHILQDLRPYVPAVVVVVVSAQFATFGSGVIELKREPAELAAIPRL